ncbi:hypothetical protein [Metabacillus fastidiosus]|uniref:hypothetical protein n=1 Tax=Metabacillus fastidiosus TaxID=1458 RepID=UPI003D2DF3F2
MDRQIETIQRVSKLEQENLGHERRIENLEEKAESIPKLETLMEMVIETTKENSKTMKSVDQNITGLNSEMKNIANEVSTVSGRVETLEKDKKDTEEEKKKTKKEIRMKTFDLILKIAGALLIAYLSIMLGLSK